jgi:hypothetical protein
MWEEREIIGKRKERETKRFGMSKKYFSKIIQNSKGKLFPF